MPRLLLLAGLAVTLAACSAPNPIGTYPSFPERYDALDTTRAVVDVTMLHDVSGSTDELRLPYNERVADAVTALLVEGLERKGYPVHVSYPGAIGFFLEEDTPVRIVDDERAVIETATRPPFYADPTLQADTVLVDAIWAARVDPEGPAGPAGRPDAIVALFVRGRSVPFMKQLGQSLLTSLASSLLTGGFASVSVHEISGVFVGLQVIDGRTGQIIWSDLREIRDTHNNERAVLRAAEWLVDRLPARGALAPQPASAEGP